MKTSSWCVPSALCSLLIASASQAQTLYWTDNDTLSAAPAGGVYWGTASGWSTTAPNPVTAASAAPNGVGATITINNTALTDGSARTKQLADATGTAMDVTLGGISHSPNSSSDTRSYTIASDVGTGTAKLIFDATGTANATISMNAAVSNRLTISAGVQLNDNLVVSGTGRADITGSISENGGARSLTKSGAASLFLGGASTYSGGTTITGGSIRLTGGANRLLSTSSLTITPANTTTGTFFDLNGNNQTLASINVGSNTGNHGLIVSHATTAATLTISSTTADSAVSGRIYGNMNLVKEGAGTTLTLSESNAFTGTTTIDGGVIEANGGASVIAAGGTVTGATISANAASFNVGDTTGLVVGQSVSGVGVGSGMSGKKLPDGAVITGLSATTVTVAFSASNNSSDTFYRTSTGQSYSLTFGALNGAALGTGAVVVNNGGTLTGSGTFKNSSITINSGGLLKGTGVYDSAIIVAGGTLAPGNSPGILTANQGISFDSSATFAWELAALSETGAGTNFDQIALTGGNVTIASGAALSVFIGAGLEPSAGGSFWDESHSWTVIENTGAGSIVGLFSIDNSSWSEHGSFSTGVVDGDLVLTWTASTIPEPSTYAALLGAASLGLVAWRRRPVR